MSGKHCIFMSSNQANNHGNTIANAPETEGLSEETRARLSEIRRKLEPHIATFDGREMWYQERRLQFQGVAHITTDNWGVRIRFESDNFRTLTLSGRWDFILAYSDSLGAQYCGWTLSLECLYPEFGTMYG